MSEKTIIDKRKAAKETFVIPQSDVAPSSLTEDFKAASSSSDIHKLFEKFNKLFFWGKLNGVKLEWSNKMTRCAGKCYSRPRQKYYCIRLSRPLLAQRPHSDLVETLLHEMIHAYLSVTGTREYDSHGNRFHEHMYRINKAVGTNISVYHTFHKEVSSLKQHWWRCDGPCRNRGPYYGWAKRAVNRAPGPWDFWWRSHGNRCGGRFVKVKEPIEFTRKRVHNLVGYGVTSEITRLSLNHFGFEFMYSGDTFVGNKGRFPSPHMGVSRGETTRSNMIDCPVCNKRIRKGVLNEHLKVCEDLKTIFEDDGFSGRCFGKNNLDPSTCPLCSTPMFRGSIKEHLEKCDGLQDVFDGENSSTTDDGECVSAKRESSVESCLVCEELLGGISLKDHLESCEGLQGIFDDEIIVLDDDCVGKESTNCRKTQGIFDDEIIVLDDDCDGKESTNCKNVQQCPICNNNVANLSDHLSTCLNFNDESTPGVPNTTDTTAIDDKTTTTNNVSVKIANKASGNSCPICGLEMKTDINNHLERVCLSTLSVSEFFNLPFPLEATAKNIYDLSNTLEESHVSSLLKCDRPSSTTNDDICVNSPSKYPDTRRKETDQNMLKADCETLIFCRSCKKFYSVSHCPVCRENKNEKTRVIKSYN